MDFANERYVRLYVRDTLTWGLVGWEGNAVLALLMRKLDRAGVLDIGDSDPFDAVAMVTRLPIEVTRTGLSRLLERGAFEVGEGCIIMPNFLEAQEADQTNAQRCREYRARRRDTKRVASNTKRVISDPARMSRDPSTMSRDTPAVPSQLTQPKKTPLPPSLVLAPKVNGTNGTALHEPSELRDLFNEQVRSQGVSQAAYTLSLADRGKKPSAHTLSNCSLAIQKYPERAWWVDCVTRACGSWMVSDRKGECALSLDFLVRNSCSEAEKLMTGAYGSGRGASRGAPEIPGIYASHRRD